MKNHRGIRDFEEFRDAVVAYRLPRVILTALDLDLFTVMGGRPWTAAALARRLRVSPRGLEILCRNLATAGLLTKRGLRYRNTRLGLGELNAKSPRYRGAYLQLIRSHYDDWSQLTKSVRRGRPVEGDAPDNPAYRRRFSWAMHHRSKDIAPKVAAQIDLRGARSLLDLGGGPGTYALAFLAKNPTLQATVCDRGPALQVARQLARQVKHGRRLAYLSLDFMEQTLTGRYDVIWYSNVLHIYSPAENQRLFRRLGRHLNPGGRLLIQDAFTTDREGLAPADTNLFAVTMLLFTKTGNTYGLAETTRWLKAAGFPTVRRIALRRGTEDWEGALLDARKARSRRR